MERRWLLWASGAALMGIYFSFYWPFLILLIGILSLGILFLNRQKQVSTLVLVGILLFSYGAIAVWVLKMYQTDISSYEGQMVEIRGTAYCMDGISNSFRLHRAAIITQEKGQKLHYDLLIHIKNGTTLNDLNGRRVVIRTRMDPLKPYHNPRSFDLKAYRFTQGYEGEFGVAFWQIQSLGRSPLDVRAFLYDIRSWYGRHLEAVMPEEAAGVAFGMAIGDTTMIPEDLEQSYRLSGLGHILSVSGLHFAILYDVLKRLLAVLKTSRNTEVTVVVAVLTAMGFLNGWTPPALRSWGMILLLIVAQRVHRRYDGICVLSAVALFSCLIQPLTVLQIGFQLSYAAVLALFTLTRPIQTHLKLPQNWLGEYLSASLAVQIGIAPLGLFWFAQWNPVGMITNYPVLIFSGWLMPLLAIFPMSVMLGGPIVSFNGYVIGQLVIAMNHCSRFLNDWSERWVFAAPVLFRLISIYALLILLTRMMIPVAGGERRRLWFSNLLLTLVILTFGVQLSYQPGSKITFWDVGQGDSALLSWGKTNVLIDTGPAQARMDQVLLKNRITRLDVMVITHGHEDHIGGALTILDRLTVHEIWLGAKEPRNPLYTQLIQKAKERRVPIHFVRVGEVYGRSSEGSLTVLAPAVSTAGENLNQTSVVVMFQQNQLKILFTGDEEKEGEERLLSQQALTPVTLIKVPHHGSPTSSTEPFLKALSPKVALVSVGRNLYGHPNRGIMNRYQQYGAHVYRTDHSGAVTVWTDGFGIHTKTTVQ